MIFLPGRMGHKNRQKLSILRAYLSARTQARSKPDSKAGCRADSRAAWLDRQLPGGLINAEACRHRRL